MHFRSVALAIRKKPLRSWVDGHGKLCPRRVGGKNVYTKAGGCLLLNNASFHCL